MMTNLTCMQIIIWLFLFVLSKYKIRLTFAVNTVGKVSQRKKKNDLNLYAKYEQTLRN